MNKSLLENLYKSLLQFDDQDDIQFSKTSHDYVKQSTDLVGTFIDTRIMYGKTGPLTELEQEAIKMMQTNSLKAYDGRVHVNTLSELKNYLQIAHKYIGNTGSYNWLDVSSLTSFSDLFGGMTEFADFNGDISRWDTSNVINMNYTFTGLYEFDQDLSGWDFSKVKYMAGCFSGCNNEFIDKMKPLINIDQLKTKHGIF